MTGPGWKAILRINAQLAYGSVLVGLGWFGWSVTTKEFWQLGLLVVLIGVSGLALMLRGLVEAASFLIRCRRLARFERIGGTPKADRLATADELRDRGMLR